MKGISSVVAVILLLLVTIALVGFATGFLQDVVTSLGQGATTEAETTMQRLSQTIIIESAAQVGADTQVTIRATGSSDINTGLIAVFVGGALQSCNGGWNPGIVTSGSISTCTVSDVACPANTVVKVTAPGNEATERC